MLNNLLLYLAMITVTYNDHKETFNIESIDDLFFDVLPDFIQRNIPKETHHEYCSFEQHETELYFNINKDQIIHVTGISSNDTIDTLEPAIITMLSYIEPVKKCKSLSEKIATKPNRIQNQLTEKRTEYNARSVANPLPIDFHLIRTSREPRFKPGDIFCSGPEIDFHLTNKKN